MNKWLVIQFILLTSFSCVSLADDDDDSSVSPNIEMVASVVTKPVIEMQIHQTIIAYGTILPDADQVTTLSMPHAGMVENVWVRPGQKVKQGDLLFSLNASPGEKMTFLQAQSAVVFAKKDLERQQTLLSQHLATNAQVSAAKKTLQDANINLASLQKQGLGDTLQSFRAHQNGIVTLVNIQAGQRVQADTSAIQIASDQQFVVRLGVEPEELAKLQIGQTVKIKSVFGLVKPFTSKVDQIHAMLNPTTHLVDVIVSIPTNQSQLYVIGSRLKGEIQLTLHSALIVPRSAVLSDADGHYVFSVKDHKAQKIAVQTGQVNHDWIEITQGLNLDEPVVTKGNYELEPGMKVLEETK